MNNTFFIAGTDTDVGKTVVAAGLLQAANDQGKSTYGLKPLAAGAYDKEDSLRNEDAELLIAHSSVTLPYTQVNPVVFKAAKAPHLAAMDEGRRVDLSRLEGFCRGSLMAKADFKIIEGVGGWRVPLNAREMMSGLPQRLNVPVILVVGLRLGCLNHALLTAEAIKNDGLNLVAWVGNCIDPDMASIQANIETLKSLLPVPLLGVVEWQNPVDIAQVSRSLDISLLLDQ